MISSDDIVTTNLVENNSIETAWPMIKSKHLTKPPAEIASKPESNSPSRFSVLTMVREEGEIEDSNE